MTLFVQTVALGALVGGILALAASGLTLIFGVLKVINIAQGAFLILAAFFTWTLWTKAGIDPILAIVVMMPVMFAVGLLVYTLTVRRIQRAAPSTTVIMTFGIAIVLEGIMGFVWGNTSHAVTPSYFTASFHVVGLFLPKAEVYGAAAASVLLVCLYVVLTRTWLGRAIRAISQNAEAAQLVGIDTASIGAFAFAIGIATTGAGGPIISVLSPFVPGSHVQWISRLLAVVVLGGMGSLSGMAIGALVLGVAESLTSVYVSLNWATAVPYLVILVVLLVRPQGIMGAQLREDVV